MTGARTSELEDRLRELVAQARDAGELEALRGGLTAALAELGPEPPASLPDDVTGRFGIIGRSPAMLEVFALLEKVAKSDVSVLVLGETGTGKELVARALHDSGPRKGKPFLAENCAAVPANLLESELFGHVRGSFTGAVGDRQGHFVAADGGTVFLDEIGDMPLAMQAKLLRVLQDGEVRPVGSNKTVRIDVRVVAATHRDLERMTREGGFREDLYFRLNVIALRLPPLRERPGDVELLVAHFLDLYAREDGKRVELSSDALAALARWRWPGNVRELQNEVRRAVALSTGRIELADLSPAIVRNACSTS